MAEVPSVSLWGTELEAESGGRKMKVSDIITFLKGCRHTGDLARRITGVSSLAKASEGSLVFCRRGNEEALKDLKGCIILLSGEDLPPLDDSNTYVMVDDPRLAFARLLRSFFAPNEDRLLASISMAVHPTVVIECGHFHMGKNVEIGPYTCIDGDCSIGANTRIGSHVCIKGKVVIGENVCISPQAVVGASAGSYIRNEVGGWEYNPQLGGVLIADDVGIGSNAIVHRAALEDTIIGRGSKIGANCYIGHNSVIGEDTFIAGKTIFGGRTKVGDYCHIGLSVVTIPGIKIGDNVLVGAGAVVTRDIESGCVAYGNPARVKGDNPERYGE